MAACNFIIPFFGSAQYILSKAQSAVQGAGGTFSGDDTGGAFQVNVFGSTIKGSVAVSGQQLNIVIDSKPFLVPCSTIESFLRNQLAA